ncbi:hypothetical protein LCGC14_0664230 [marine sediment metagenome]|uniref:Uncharacterized protein n=1 Tax=marine sediment metagenome TaxID=412755 RepID=A0A0F9RCX1_9ZZZZ
MTKQEHIEAELDRIGENMVTGQELLALIALHARKVKADWKPSRFIKEFAESLGYRFSRELLYIDIAVRVVNYLYPENRVFWDVWDDIYLNRVKNSAWLQLSLTN